MGRGLVGRPAPCVEHPHRAAVDRCDVCFRRFCAECFVRDGPQLRCRECWTLAPIRAAELARRRRLGYRLRRGVARVRVSRGGLVVAALLAGFFGLAVVGSLTGTGGVGVQVLRDDPGVALRLATQRYCSAGEGQSGDVPDVGAAMAAPPAPMIRTETGALASAPVAALPDSGDTGTVDQGQPPAAPADLSPRQVDFFNPLTLVQRRDEGSPGWRSHTAVLPQQVGYDLGGLAIVDRVAFRQTPLAPPASWAREVSLLLSTKAPDAGYYRVGRWALAPTLAPQEFIFVETPARYARVCILSTYGTADFASLGAVVLGAFTSDLQAGNQPLLPPPAPSRAFTH